jgi:hypothetical protein
MQTPENGERDGARHAAPMDSAQEGIVDRQSDDIRQLWL